MKEVPSPLPGFRWHTSLQGHHDAFHRRRGVPGVHGRGAAGRRIDRVDAGRFVVLLLPTYIPDKLPNMEFAAIGCSLGSGVSRDLPGLSVKWPLSLCGLTLVMAAILFSTFLRDGSLGSQERI